MNSPTLLERKHSDNVRNIWNTAEPPSSSQGLISTVHCPELLGVRNMCVCARAGEQLKKTSNDSEKGENRHDRLSESQLVGEKSRGACMDQRQRDRHAFCYLP